MFYFTLSQWFIVIHHHGFNLHFPNVEYIFICHLYIFIEMSLYVFGPFSNWIICFLQLIFEWFCKLFYLLIWEREREIYCSTYLCIHWLICVCAPTGDWIRSFGILGWRSKPSYLARALEWLFLMILYRCLICNTFQSTFWFVNTFFQSVSCLSIIM